MLTGVCIPRKDVSPRFRPTTWQFYSGRWWLPTYFGSAPYAGAEDYVWISRANTADAIGFHMMLQ